MNPLSLIVSLFLWSFLVFVAGWLTRDGQDWRGK